LPGFSQDQYYEDDETNRLQIAVEGATVPMDKTCPTTSSWCREYDYDHFGNRWVGYSNRSLHMATPTSAGAYTATTNRLSAGTYDNAGNMTAHPYITPGGGSITYDANNLASSFTATGVSVLTRFDAKGRRVRKDVNGTARIYVYDARGRLAAEYTMGTVTTQAGTYYRTTDYLGSTWVRETSANESPMRHRNRSTADIKTGAPPLSGSSMAATCLLAMWCPVYRWRDSNLGSRAELENLGRRWQGKRRKRWNREAESTNAPARGRLLRSSEEAG